MSFVLRVPADVAQSLVDKKEARSYTDKKRDLHEADLTHLERAVAVYDDLTQLFPKDFQRIDCVRDQQLMSIDTVQELIWQKVRPMLPEPHGPARAKAPEAPVPEALQNPYLGYTAEGHLGVTAAGHEFLTQAVTNPTGNVYAFTDKLSPRVIAAVMDRLGSRGDDVRLIMLDEFATAQASDALLAEANTPQHIMFEGASNLLAKKLERGRRATYVEQSPLAIRYDQKDVNGNYKYYVPDHLPVTVKARYCADMDEIFTQYAAMVQSLTGYLAGVSSTPKAEQNAAWQTALRDQACDVLRPVLPVAAKMAVGVRAAGQPLEDLVTRLLADELPEARKAGEQLLAEQRKLNPAFLKDAAALSASTTYRAQASRQLTALAEKYLPANHATEAAPVQLTDIWPRNELELVPDMLYTAAGLPLADLRREVSSWPYNRKLEVFEAYVGERQTRQHTPGRALEKAHYSWDLLTDYRVFQDLQRHQMVDDLEWQQLTPRYGYEVPRLVEDAGLTDQYEACFDRSLAIYSALQQAGYPLEAQYATLLGHRLRWKLTYNAREAFCLHEQYLRPGSDPACRTVVRHMHQRLAEAHPLLAEAMQFAGPDQNS